MGIFDDVPGPIRIETVRRRIDEALVKERTF
jgi:hypothetical protein